MESFNLNKKYDVITILFNSIGYLNKKQLIKTFKNVYQHLNRGGVFLIETIFLKNKLSDLKNHIRKYKDKNLTILRNLNIKIKGKKANLHARYKINSDDFIEEDKQEIILLEEKELKNIFLNEGFDIKLYKYDQGGTILFLGIKN